MVKVIGFMKNVDHYKTNEGFLKSTIFQNACKTTAIRLGISIESLFTKRQAGKFKRGHGIVFTTIYK